LKLSGKAAPHEMWPVISDAHYPERVDPAAAYGISYDGDICLRRMEKVRDAVIRYKDLRATAYPVQKIVCAATATCCRATFTRNWKSPTNCRSARRW
jgi:hypothetical protein